ncbi:hypothetical protein GSI_13751 [Ganoderma sinense ZZ0214-1]|uniref:Transporter n=1 Tax=Ganoderma sinense ZZ0214-1 TaxID=1077348 RepID=A0A2G8RR59_9APHY|nr:hypothetical protein GSI_13751 [Ganoderma sinense ZZ0214-1]
MFTPLDESPDVISRGRPEVRAADLSEDTEEWRTASFQRRDSRVSRKGATMVFMGVWALFGVGTFAGDRLSPSGALVQGTGKVLAREDYPPESLASTYDAVIDPRLADPILSAQLAGGTTVLEFTHSIDFEGILSGQAEPHPSAPSLEFIIGRISAWICTTLYLTSRLPQIWKNFVRKSIEGLSIYLFIFAFLGNTFYVASILTSPKLQLPPPQASAFIRESIPYLLGSGGTLMFDITIVCQAILYRQKGGPSRIRHPSRSYDEEEAGLLSAEATGAHEESPVISRRRGASITPEPGVEF